MRKHFIPRTLLLSILLGALVAAPSFSDAPGFDAEDFDWFFVPRAAGENGEAPEGVTTPPLAMVVDDGIAEGDFGVGGSTAQQFLWFNRLTAPRPLRLEEIHVLFPAAAGSLDVGAAIELLVYEDADGDPSNG
ncbi:MAG: hypothetical protein MI919_24850, partial [Holophagales bacterium]|nr:hypothetical protein [Holophagales bacterium]